MSWYSDNSALWQVSSIFMRPSVLFITTAASLKPPIYRWVVCVNCVSASLHDRLHYFETLHHDSLRHRITKRDVEQRPHNRILEYTSHNRSVWLYLL